MSPSASWAIAVASAVFVAACGPKSDPTQPKVACGAASTYPNDLPVTQSDADSCRAGVAGPCGEAYQAFYDCFADHRVCAYDGTTDVLATNQACVSDANALSACGDAGGPG